MVRVGGRIRRAAFPLALKHPCILPKRSHITDLIIEHFHEKVACHQGRGITHNAVRQARYWIVNGRSTVTRAISKCVICRRFHGQPLTQKMSDLPEESVAETAPFHYTGMDVFDPFYIKEGRKTLKRYRLLFTCLASRAMHLETLNSMEADSFISALRRFINRQGKVRELRSDRWTNFAGARNDLLTLCKSWTAIAFKTSSGLKIAIGFALTSTCLLRRTWEVFGRDLFEQSDQFSRSCYKNKEVN